MIDNLIIVVCALGFFGCLVGMLWTANRLSTATYPPPKRFETYRSSGDKAARAIAVLGILAFWALVVWLIFF